MLQGFLAAEVDLRTAGESHAHGGDLEIGQVAVGPHSGEHREERYESFVVQRVARVRFFIGNLLARRTPDGSE